MKFEDVDLNGELWFLIRSVQRQLMEMSLSFLIDDVLNLFHIASKSIVSCFVS